MKLSTKGLYALRILRRLAEYHETKPLSVAFLSQLEGVSVKYLEQILGLLKKKGLLVSIKGKNGGYSLRKPPDEITLGEIIRAVDGPLAPMPCASRTAPYVCSDGPFEYDSCWLRHLMLRVRDNISAILDKETLTMMVNEASGSVPRKSSGSDPIKSCKP